HDNESNWLDWGLLTKHADILRFASLLNSRRAQRGIEHERQRVTLNQLIQQATKSWHGVKLHEPDWGDASRSMAFTVMRNNMLVHLMFNAYWQPLDFDLARAIDRSEIQWRRWIDTALDSPDDICEWKDAPPHGGHSYHVESRSVVVLVAESGRSL